MEIQKLEDNNTLSTSILTFGNFDGIHLGHNFIIHKLIKLSSDNNIPSVLITFDPHTNLILNKIKKNDFKILTSFKQKCDILNSYKIDFLCKISFDKHFSKISASDFMDLIIKKYNPKIILIGYDNYFGNKREGSYKFIKNNNNYKHIKLIEIIQYKHNNNSIKSSIIKDMIQNGSIDKGNLYLGRKYSINGYVIKGDGLSKETGFKTANIKLTNNKQLIPGNGVYSVNLKLEQKTYVSICNIGICPTIKNSKNKSIEVHVIDEDINIYDKEVNLEFISYIRTEKKFENALKLNEQILNDINHVKNERMINSGWKKN